MADTMMERLRNYFGGDHATTEGSDPLGLLSGGVGGDPDADRGRLVDPGPLGGMEDFKESFRDVVAMNDAEVLKEFIRSSMGDMMAIAQDDPAFAVEFYRAANMFPETRAMLPPSLRTGSRISDRDLDAVRGVMESSFDEGLTYGDPSAVPYDAGAFSGMRGEMPEDYYEGKALTHMVNSPEPGSGRSPMMGMSPDLPDMSMENFGPQFRLGEDNGPFDRDLSAGTEGGYGREPMPMEYAGGGYVNKPRAMGHGGYVQGQGSSMDRAEKENVRPVNRTLSTALSPTLSIKLFG